LADEEALQKVPILVLANKQDLLNAMTAAELMQELGLTDYKECASQRREPTQTVRPSFLGLGRTLS